MGSGKGNTKRVSSVASKVKKAGGDAAYKLKSRFEVTNIGNDVHRSGLQSYSRAVAHPQKLNVRFNGEQEQMPALGYTDMMDNIVLDKDPSQIIGRKLTDVEKYLVISGVLEHELTHCRWYDKDVHAAFVSRMESLQRSGDMEKAIQAQFISRMSNVLLDGNNEQRLLDEEPLSYRKISFLNRIWKRIPEDFIKKNKDEAGQVMGAIHAYALPEYGVNESQLKKKAKACFDECKPVIDRAVYGDSQDVMDCTDEIYEIMKRHNMLPDPDEMEKMAQQQPGGQAQPGEGTPQPGQGQPQQGGGGGQSQEKDDSDSGDEDGEGGGSGDEKEDGKEGDKQGSGSGGDEEGDEKDGAGGDKKDDKDGEGDEKKDGKSGSGGDEDEEPHNTNQSKPGGDREQPNTDKDDFEKAKEAAQKEIDANKNKQESQDKSARKKGNLDGDSWSAPPNEKITSEKTIAVSAGNDYDLSRGKLSSMGNQMATQLKELQTESIARTRFQKFGKLDAHRLAKVPTGNDKVFYKQGEELALDIAASVILDLSGSMSHQRRPLQDASIVSQVAMDKLHIPHEIWGYSGGYSASADHYEYKAFGSNRAKGLGRIGNTGDSVAPGGGSTPTREAVNFGTARMKQRQEENKIMFVFTDGQPNDTAGTVEAVRNAKKNGITVLGILFDESANGNGWGSSNDEMMRKIFGEDHLIIQDISELPRAVGKRLKKMLKISR